MVPQSRFTKQNEPCLDKWKPFSEPIVESENSHSGGFDCNICLDSVQDPVVTLCGHLYCWPCIYKWIHHQSKSSQTPNNPNPPCPVCKTQISQNTLVPLYSHGSNEKSLNLGSVIPHRPVGSSCRVQPISTQQVNHHGYRQRVQPPMDMTGLMTNVINPTSPTMTVFTEMVYERIFGNPQASLYAYRNSYDLAAISTQRARRQAMQADSSLGRIWFFLFCCAMVCLILF